MHILDLGLVHVESRIHDALFKLLQIEVLAAILVQQAQRSGKWYGSNFIIDFYICTYIVCIIQLQGDETPILQSGGVLKTKQKYVSINGLKKQNPNKNMLEQNKDK